MNALLLVAAVSLAAPSYVRPAPKGFKPVDQDRKLELRLTFKDTIIKKSTASAFVQPWLALELQNVGRQPALFRQDLSPFKRCKDSDLMKLKIVNEAGEEREAFFGGHGPRLDKIWPKNTDEKRAAQIVKATYNVYPDQVSVMLQPGETFLMHPRKVRDLYEDTAYAIHGHGLSVSFEGRFCRYIEQYLLEPGRYMAKVVLYDYSVKPDDRRAPTDRDYSRYLQRTLPLEKHDEDLFLGVVESNTVAFEVVP